MKPLINFQRSLHHIRIQYKNLTKVMIDILTQFFLVLLPSKDEGMMLMLPLIPEIIR